MRLTTDSIRVAICSDGRSEEFLWDDACPGLGVRLRSTGAKSFVVVYRAGKGRAAPVRRVTLGAVGKLQLAEARTAARKIIGEVATGVDPAGKAALARVDAEA